MVGRSADQVSELNQCHHVAFLTLASSVHCVVWKRWIPDNAHACQPCSPAAATRRTPLNMDAAHATIPPYRLLPPQCSS